MGIRKNGAIKTSCKGIAGNLLIFFDSCFFFIIGLKKVWISRERRCFSCPGPAQGFLRPANKKQNGEVVNKNRKPTPKVLLKLCYERTSIRYEWATLANNWQIRLATLSSNIIRFEWVRRWRPGSSDSYSDVDQLLNWWFRAITKWWHRWDAIWMDGATNVGGGRRSQYGCEYGRGGVLQKEEVRGEREGRWGAEGGRKRK